MNTKQSIKTAPTGVLASYIRNACYAASTCDLDGMVGYLNCMDAIALGLHACERITSADYVRLGSNTSIAIERIYQRSMALASAKDWCDKALLAK